MECDEDLEVVIQIIRAKYVKGFKGTWMECDEKFTSNKIVRRKEIGLLMQYNE